MQPLAKEYCLDLRSRNRHNFVFEMFSQFMSIAVTELNIGVWAEAYTGLRLVIISQNDYWSDRPRKAAFWSVPDLLPVLVLRTKHVNVGTFI